MSFKNPYHFVPAAQAGARTDLGVRAVRNQARLNHAAYGKNLHSGTIRCRLHLASPAVIGAAQYPHDGAPTSVQPFQLDGNPAIPGSTLRGMISSIAEAASNSALRVLDQKPYSYHKSMRHPHVLSAIGKVVQLDNGFGLVPLTIPTLPEQNGQFKLPERFQKYFPSPNLRVYVGHAREGQTDGLYIKSSAFKYRTSDATKPPDWHASVPRYTWGKDFTLSSVPGKDGYLLGQWPSDGQQPSAEPGGKVPGYMRVLGCWESRFKDIPPTKKHELFLPLPTEPWPTIPIPQRVIDKFHALADERCSESEAHPERPLLPFHPLDRPRGGPGNKVRLQAGDLVYFDVENDNEKKYEICEISFSAIWRDFVETAQKKPATAHDFFRKVDPELLPFGADRKKITPAEQLFGFATEDQREDALNAYAGRVRFSDALLAAEQNSPFFEKQVTLKILSSPKPPCPAMYFKPRADGKRIAKHDLHPDWHAPQGRKFYLHHHVAPKTSPWQTADNQNFLDQKAAVTPLRTGLEFTFSIDFDNLSANDLGLLLYALAPEADFHHKLGMGKPLGLGSVKLSIESCQKVDRAQRYTVAGLSAERYQPLQGWEQIRDDYKAKMMRPDIKNALCLLGRIPADGTIPIHTPTIEPAPGQSLDLETKTFQWFVANDEAKGPQKALPPLTDQDTELPTLERCRSTEHSADRSRAAGN